MKRRIIIVAIFLLAGAVVNVAVACVIWCSVLRCTVSSPGGPFRSVGYHRGYSLPVQPSSRHWAVILQVGWPTFALRSEPPPGTYSVPQRRSYPSHSFVVTSTGRSRGELVLSLRPIWPGFTVNTVFYAVILWLLILGPFVLRRFIRARRGLCPKCAYPMGESPICSECGKALPQRARVAK